MTDFFLFNEFKKKPTFSNYYLTDKELFNSVGNCNFEFVKQEGLIYVLKGSTFSFKRMFFFLHKENVNEKVQLLKSEDSLVCETVFSVLDKNQDDIISKWLSSNDYFHYRTFMRMHSVSKQEFNDVDFSKVIKPSENDIYEIEKKLLENFDVFSERIPTFKELSELMNTTYIIKENNIITSLLISEIKGKTEELRYWLVLPEFRNLGHGSLLMKYFLNSNIDTLRYTLWVNVLNINAIKKYESFGFVKDKLINKIFINIKIMKDKIVEILKDTRPEFEFEEGINFIDAGYLDSFDLITIVSDLENTFDVKINGAQIVPETFQSVDTIMDVIKSSKNAS